MTKRPLPALLAEVMQAVENPRVSLPKDVFYFVSQLTPMVNVDLLVKNVGGETLLTWREDEFYGPGWHIPGGILRFKEYAATRIQKVADSELGASVMAEVTPIVVREVMASHRDIRGHFISMVYRCALTTMPDESRRFDPGNPKNGQWMWHSGCPSNIIPQHESYRPLIDGP
jgi:colanic acid biosynthesis protein WcaH